MYKHVNLLHARLNSTGTPLIAPGRILSMWGRDNLQRRRKKVVDVPLVPLSSVELGVVSRQEDAPEPGRLKDLLDFVDNLRGTLLSSESTFRAQQYYLVPAVPLAACPLVGLSVDGSC